MFIPESGVNFDKIDQKPLKNALSSGRSLQQAMNLQPHRLFGEGFLPVDLL